MNKLEDIYDLKRELSNCERDFKDLISFIETKKIETINLINKKSEESLLFLRKKLKCISASYNHNLDMDTVIDNKIDEIQNSIKSVCNDTKNNIILESTENTYSLLSFNDIAKVCDDEIENIINKRN